jgi:elongation factor Ts
MTDSKLIKQLRDITGAGFLDCKSALEINQNDVEKASKWLKDKGAIKANKKLDKETNAGAVVASVSLDKKTAAMVEFHTETDFVTRNEKFQNFAREVASIALAQGSLLELKSARLTSGESVEEKMLEHISVIGESIKIGKYKILSVQQGVVGIYVHNPIGKMVGNVAAMVSLECTKQDKETIIVLEKLAENLSVHVASMDPKYISHEQIPHEILRNEEEEIRKDKSYANKPEHVIDRIIENKLAEFKNTLCLLEQEYILDQDFKIKDLISLEEKSLGCSISVQEFVKFSVK